MMRFPRSSPWLRSTLRSAGVALGVWLAGITAAHAEERVLVLGVGAKAPRPGLIDALRIQLAHVAIVQKGPAVRGSLPDKLRQADGPMKATGATLAVWVERAPAGPLPASDRGDTEFVLHIVSRQEDRVLVQVARLPAGEGPEVDRALALKVREVLDTVMTGEPGGADLGHGLRASPESKEPSEPQTSAERGVALALDVGALLTYGGDAGTRVGGNLGAGVRYRLSPWTIEVLGEVQLLPGGELSGPAGQVTVDEVPLNLSFRALYSVEDFRVGGRIGFGARLLSAEGTSPQGRRGSARRWVPTAMFGPELRLVLDPRIDLVGWGGLEVEFQRHRFAINESPLYDVGPLRAMGGLSLVIAVP